MRVSQSPDFLESVANDPGISGAIGWVYPGEFKSGESWDRTIGLEWQPFGGAVFLRYAPGKYSGHFVFLPKTPDVLGKCREALRYLFTETDAKVLTGKTSMALRHAIRAAKAIGMRHIFDCDGHSFCRLTREQWQDLKE